MVQKLGKFASQGYLRHGKPVSGPDPPLTIGRIWQVWKVLVTLVRVRAGGRQAVCTGLVPTTNGEEPSSDVQGLLGSTELLCTEFNLSCFCPQVCAGT